MTTATFTPDVVVCRLAATSKKQLLQQLSALAAAHAGLCERKVLSAIISREKLGSTGIGYWRPIRMDYSHSDIIRGTIIPTIIDLQSKDVDADLGGSKRGRGFFPS